MNRAAKYNNHKSEYNGCTRRNIQVIGYDQAKRRGNKTKDDGTDHNMAETIGKQVGNILRDGKHRENQDDSGNANT